MKTPLETRGSHADDRWSARLGKKQPDGTHAHRIAHVPRLRRCAHRPDAGPACRECRGGRKAREEGNGGGREMSGSTLASRTVPRMRAAEEAGPAGPAPAGAVSCGGAGNPARSV